jgi:adenosylcobinamide-GDP ribazoletransferase
MTDDLWVQRRVNDLKIGLIFLSRLPLAHQEPIEKGQLAQALWTAPIVGVGVGLVGAGVYGLAQALHVPPLPAAALAVAATVIVTGGLHEDGLADVADGFGGGATRERKLEIMRDSRIGSYGVCALILSFGLRWSALATIANPWAVALALCAAHTAARAGLPAFMSQVAPARPDGLSASAGSPPGRSVAIAFAVGILALVLALGPGKALVSLILLALSGLMLARLAIRQIGGQTGDILGAFEQTGEILILLVAAAVQIGG